MAARPVQRTQKRGIIDWMTNYPDHIAHYKAIQNKGGTMQGANNPTWLKQPGDEYVAWFGCFLGFYGMSKATYGMYNLANGTNKME
eukprot:CAMPEP_0194042970 /NCGR_PEP_ID=MMETSP0009_2-20130614/14678_1 /TAXON_ID=210454 /ORGANISM="Grammatophora oceanica, Strain CCMP 410" /LENGTH=85 /DNA_ID=CAMNT_0038687025 /DNA_START=91 /DNA_END=348 /DNA_ORIENTATION=+